MTPLVYGPATVIAGDLGADVVMAGVEYLDDGSVRIALELEDETTVQVHLSRNAVSADLHRFQDAQRLDPTEEEAA